MNYSIWPRRNEYPGGNVTVFEIAPCDIGIWIHQNDAQPLDAIEGVLQDSCLYECRNGIAAVFEHYLNPNSSDYESGGVRFIFDLWDEAAAAAAEEA